LPVGLDGAGYAVQHLKVQNCTEALQTTGDRAAGRGRDLPGDFLLAPSATD
jgi:hypothetical protein